MLLGFDIGGTKCAVILGRNSSAGGLSIADKRVMPTTPPAAAMISSLFRAAETLLADNHIRQEELSGIGISCGGPLNSRTGMILSPPNLPGWDHVPIVAMAEEWFGCKAVLQNDANACAVAEWRYGAGRGCSHMVFLTFGTGMGAGLIINGKLYPGASDAAGEAGHVRLASNGPIGFGKAGSFEGFCSGAGIAQLARKKAEDLFAQGLPCGFCDQPGEIGAITARTVADAAFAGDEAAKNIYKTCGSYLGKGLAVLTDLLNPETIVIGGIYERAQPLLEPAMRKTIAEEALAGSLEGMQIVPAALGDEIGDYAALSLAAESAEL